MSASGSATAAYIRRETGVSVAINAAISLAFFLLVFGGLDPVPLWGLGAWVFDFLPQGFMVALMSTAVPGMLASRKLAAGKLQLLDRASVLPRNLVVRALLLATVSAFAGTAAIARLAWLSGLTVLPALAAGTLKVSYGALLAAIVTPRALAAALSHRQ